MDEQSIIVIIFSVFISIFIVVMLFIANYVVVFSKLMNGGYKKKSAFIIDLIPFLYGIRYIVNKLKITFSDFVERLKELK